MLNIFCTFLFASTKHRWSYRSCTTLTDHQNTGSTQNHLTLSSSSSEEVVSHCSFPETYFSGKELRCLIRVMKGRRTPARRSEERKWSIVIDNIYNNSVVVRQHLRARAGAARKAIEIREKSQTPGRSRLQSNLCKLPRTGLNQISREGGFLEHYSRSCS